MILSSFVTRMRQKNIFAFLTCLLLALSGCAPSKFMPEEVNFPLVKSHTISSKNQITKIGVIDSFVIFESADGLQAIDPSINKPIWAEKDFKTPTVDADIMFIDNSAVLMSDSTLLLVNNLGRKTFLNLNPKRSNNMMLVAAYENYVYIIRGGNWDLEVYDISTNKMIWETPAGRGMRNVFYDSANGIAYVVTSSSMEAFNNSTGASLWKTEISADQSAYANGIIYFAHVDDFTKKYSVTSIDTRSRKVLWDNEFPYQLRMQIYGLNIFDNLLVLTADSDLSAYSLSDGAFEWRSPFGDLFYTTPVLLADTLYIKGISRKVYAVSIEDGSVKGYVHLEPQPFGVELTSEVRSGVYVFQNGIVFKTKNNIEFYAPK